MDHISGFIAPEAADRYFQELQLLPWQQVIWRQGRSLPRLVYQYVGEGIPVLEELKRLLELNLGLQIKGIWCNLYRTGLDWTPEHQDSYGVDVYTLSFGETRTFYFKHLRSDVKTKLQLAHGDLNWFTQAYNAQHKHCLAKGRKAQGPRISIVFFA